MRILATAGHVDHGKSSLVEALTGTHPDRWAEERRRGLTIDLGFAHTALPNGEEVAFVDVPGHARFIGNMLAGVRGLHGCLFVVDWREGWKPQSEEHLRILDVVGVEAGIVALTKSDLASSDDIERAADEVRRRVVDTFLHGAPIVAVSALTGDGLDDLRNAINRLVDSSAPSTDRGRPRLFVDRSFAAKGSGTVITGTLTDGSLSKGDHLLVTPGSTSVRVRSIQNHGRDTETIGPGHRVALNLAGIEHHEIRRGHVLTRADDWHVTDRVDVELSVVPGLDHPVSRRGAYVTHIGSDERVCRLHLIGASEIAPGDRAFARLHLDRPVPLVTGDRFVLREHGRNETIGGGIIVDIDPPIRRPSMMTRPTVDTIVARHGWIDTELLVRLTGESRPPTVGNWVVHEPIWHEARRALDEAIDSAGPAGLELASLDERARLVLDTLEVVVDSGRVRRPGVSDPLRSHPELERLRAGGCAPPPPTGLTIAELRRLERFGDVFERDDLWFHAAAIELARDAARRLLVAHPAGFTMSQFREALGVTRKHAVPLATELDHRGITRRRDDVRIGGPRLDG